MSSHLALIITLLLYAGVLEARGAPQSPLSQQVPALAGGDKPGTAADNSTNGMTREQADALLAELRAVHQLLDRQLAAVSHTTRFHNVRLSVGRDWHALGSNTAPVTVIEFADYQCPFCRRFDSETLAKIKSNYVDTGKVRFVSRDLPLEFHANALDAAEAVRCAGDQGKYWEMRGALFSGSTELSREVLGHAARALALNGATFQSCLDGHRHEADIRQDLADASELEIKGTPAFVIGRTDPQVIEGIRLVGAQPYPIFAAAIEHALADATSIPTESVTKP